MNAEYKPLVSIISVNYNGFYDTCEMIESINQYLSFPYELIVVDNASSQNDALRISELYPWVHCIRSEKNLGFAGGNNLGIKKACGEYLFFLNNDTYITDNSLYNLVKFLKSNPLAGAVAPKIKFADFPDEVQFAGYTAFSRVTMRNRIIGFGEKDKGQYDQPTQNPFLHGAAMLVKREVITKAGMMPDVYFLYYEELDWCERIKDAGYELWYSPSCTIYHKESKSVGQKSPLKNFYQTRNRLLFAWRNCKGIEKYLTIVYQLTIALPKNILISLLSKRTDLAMAALKGAIDYFRIENKTATKYN